MIIVTEITALAHSKGKVKVCFEQAESLILYLSEVRNYGLEEQTAVSDELYETLYHEVVGKRAVKRAMHLLEKMDRTEAQLVRKLSESGYPDELVKEAVAAIRAEMAELELNIPDYGGSSDDNGNEDDEWDSRWNDTVHGVDVTYTPAAPSNQIQAAQGTGSSSSNAFI